MVCAFAQAAGVEAMRARGRSGMQQMWLGKSARKDVFLLRDSGSGGEWRGVETGDWRWRDVWPWVRGIIESDSDVIVVFDREVSNVML
jgi:hypothetical protein